MRMSVTGTTLVALLTSAGAEFGQQNGEYILGTKGLNAGIQPAPGFAYSNQATLYGADRLKDASGQPVPVSGTFDLHINQNLFVYTSPWKVFGETFGGTFDLIIANASITAPQVGVAGAGLGVTDTYVQPVTLGFIAHTGFFQPNNPNSIGSGYWGYLPSIAGTVYLTHEFHGKKRSTNITPGQTYDLECGVGRAFPLKTNLLQFGAVGYGGCPLPGCRTRASGILDHSQVENELLLPVRTGVLREGHHGRNHARLRWGRQFSCCEMMSPPNYCYCNSAILPPGIPTAWGS
jgi:hypothetical protein